MSLAAAAAQLVHHSTGLFNPNQLTPGQLTHPISLMNGQQSSIQPPHDLLSPKSTKSNSSTSRDQTHESDLNESTSNQPNQTMQRHLNQLMHHQLLASNGQHPLLSSYSSGSNHNLTASTPSSTTSASSTTPPSQFSTTANSLVHPSFNTSSTSLTTNTSNSSALHDFHQNTSTLSAAVAALHSPGHLLNRHFSQLSHLHRLGAHYPISLAAAAGNQAALQPNHQSLIGHLQSNGQQQLIDTLNSTPVTGLTSSSTSAALTNTTPSTNLYSINQLSQLSHYAQLGFLGCNSAALNSLQLNSSNQQLHQTEQQHDRSEQESKKRLSNGSDEEACFTDDEDCDQDDMEINVASDDEDLKADTSETDECKTEKFDKNSKSNRNKKVNKRLKTKPDDSKSKDDEEVNVDEDENKESDENNCSKIDELLRNSKDERRKIKLKPYKLISSNSIVGSA